MAELSPDEHYEFNRAYGRKIAAQVAAQRGRPSGGPLPGAGEGQLFSTGPFTRPRDEPQEPGWGVPHGRPTYPGQRGGGPHPQEPGPQPPAQQMQLPFQKPSGPFADKGIGRFVARNGNGMQFNKPAIKQAVQNGITAYDDARYFRHAGFGAALRHTLGMDQAPSHRSDDINARKHASERDAAMGGNHGVTGVDPGHVEGYHAGHMPSSFEPGLSW